MTKEQKETIIAMRGRGSTFAKIAEALGISLNTVKSYCYRNMPNANQEPRCKHCGVPIPIREKYRPRLFCSDKCRIAHWRKVNPKRTTYKLVCQSCGKTFESNGNRTQKYCSHACYICARFGERQDTHG